MKKKNFLVLLFSVFLLNPIFAQIITPGTIPNKTQQLLINRAYGMFIHFGVNTFADLEWSDGSIQTEI